MTPKKGKFLKEPVVINSEISILLGQENVIDSGAVACGVVGALCFLDDHSQNISAQILGDSRFLLLVK